MKYAAPLLFGILLTAFLISTLNLAIAPSTGTTSADVSVNTVISITLTPCPAGGSLGFGSLNPGTVNKSATCQNSTVPAVNVTVDDVTNIDVNISVKGTNYLHTDTINFLDVRNTPFNATSFTTGPYQLKTGDQNVTKVAADTGADSINFWFWISTPNAFLKAGTYTSTYTFGAAQA